MLFFLNFLDKNFLLWRHLFDCGNFIFHNVIQLTKEDISIWCVIRVTHFIATRTLWYCCLAYNRNLLWQILFIYRNHSRQSFPLWRISPKLKSRALIFNIWIIRQIRAFIRRRRPRFHSSRSTWRNIPLRQPIRRNRFILPLLLFLFLNRLLFRNIPLFLLKLRLFPPNRHIALSWGCSGL